MAVSLGPCWCWTARCAKWRRAPTPPPPRFGRTARTTWRSCSTIRAPSSAWSGRWAAFAKKLPLKLTPGFDSTRILTAGTTTPLRFKLEPTQGHGSPPVNPEEIRVLLFKTPGTWQLRTEPRRIAEGEFAVDFTPPSAGQYKFVVGVESRGIDLGRLPHFTFGVDEAPAPATASASEVHR